MTWLFVILALMGFGWWAKSIAEAKGLDGWLWAFVGFALGPAGVLIAAGMPRR